MNQKTKAQKEDEMILNRTILEGDAIDKLKKIGDNSTDLILTDPPYGYSFMNKDWDKALISIDIWKECLRVLKPGSFAFVMSAPRQDVLSHMIVNLTDAGFKTDFTSMYWAYASGFPKAMNMSKAIDIRNGRDSKEYKKLDGSYAGFQPKPAVEVILVCMKPLSEKNYVEQALSNGKGVTWFDDCRIPFVDEKDVGDPNRFKGVPMLPPEKGFNQNKVIIDVEVGYKNGRFPANLIVSDNSLDDGKIYKTGGKANSVYMMPNNFFNKSAKLLQTVSDSGSFSQYYSLDSWEAQFIITPKPSKSEKNKGLEQYLENLDKYEGKFPCSKKLSPHKVNDGRKKDADNPFQRGKTVKQNTHPTVKPVSLFKYLITMGSRENDLVLDPFMGSGTTAIACEQTAREWIGIEKNPEYVEIFKARLADYKKQNKLEAFLDG